MRRFLNIRPAGAGGQPRVRRVALALALLAIVSSLASPLAAQASLNDDLQKLSPRTRVPKKPATC